MHRAQGIIRKAREAGDLVEVRVLYEVLCDSCAYGLRTGFAEEFKHRRQVNKTRKQELSKMPFSKYQQSREWKVKRSRVLSLAGHRCQLCNKVGSPGSPLEVHHNNYDRYGDELLSDLVALCDEVTVSTIEKLYRTLPNKQGRGTAGADLAATRGAELVA
jgi:5-methylcytosine-specific restriction endonuclease McrA